ncbi:MAG: nucleoside deaminase, partial [Boseongicola sp.]|nr:nucleoside deaminase [Boseongicola sp.]
MTFNSQMKTALEEANTAAQRGEVPVGAVLVGPD